MIRITDDLSMSENVLFSETKGTLSCPFTLLTFQGKAVITMKDLFEVNPSYTEIRCNVNEFSDEFSEALEDNWWKISQTLITKVLAEGWEVREK